MTDQPLSPSAQAVLDAAFFVYDEEEHLYVATCEQHAGMIAAAALRAAADQVVPEPQGDPTTWTQCAFLGVREELLAIAAELD